MIPIIVSVVLLLATVAFGVVGHYKSPKNYYGSEDYYSFGWAMTTTMVYLFTTIASLASYFAPNREDGFIAWEYWWTLSLAYGLYLAYWYFGWFYTSRIKYNRIIKGRMAWADDWDDYDPNRTLNDSDIQRILDNAEKSVEDSTQWGSWPRDNFAYLQVVRSRDSVGNVKPDKRRERARKALQDG